MATAQNPFYQLLEVDLNGKSLDNNINIDAKNISVVNSWDLGTKYDVHIMEVPEKIFTDKDRMEIKNNFEALINMSEQELYNLKSQVNTEDDQEKLNKTINLKITPLDEWTDTNYKVANHMINQIQKLNEIKSGEVEEDLISKKELALKLHGHRQITNLKENSNMATQDVGDPIVVKTEAENDKPSESTPVVEEKAATVSEPRVAELVEKTG